MVPVFFDRMKHLTMIWKRTLTSTRVLVRYELQVQDFTLTCSSGGYSMITKAGSRPNAISSEREKSRMYDSAEESLRPRNLFARYGSSRKSVRRAMLQQRDVFYSTGNLLGDPARGPRSDAEMQHAHWSRISILSYRRTRQSGPTA